MGVFPEDYEIKVSKLIKLWVAEGFLEPSGSKSYEEQAGEYLKDLVERSLILVTKMKSNGKKIKACNIHDLVRDLCIKTAQEEKFHLNQCRTSTDFIPFLSPLQRMLSSFKDCKALRVLDAVELTLGKFPDQILELFLLRYLAFSIPDHKWNFDVPSRILKLENLQTLIIFSKMTTKTGHLKSRVLLPLKICMMTKLRHLILVGAYPLPCPPPGSFPLENLQTLAVVINFKCTESILQMIPKLRKLKVVYNGYEINWPIYHLDNLVHLHHLENLNIDVEHHRFAPVPLSGKLAFPMMLRTLKLRGCCFSSQDMAIVGSLPNLQVLKLRDCFFEGGKWETIEGEFPQLKFLQINSTNLQCWITESSHFSSLERLMLFWCLGLREIPDVIGEIPTLVLIAVRRCEKSLAESAQRIKEEQESFGNDSLQVRIVDRSAGGETYKVVASASNKVRR
ncbi:hypothetical protein BUALT_Bualt06G0006700 [Buddleja alternifolia]|uniref:Uncharacterized protein n=1 Tax=Buddleja alternifolia TaxID=168488 RepID=A0AAV6XCZ9_9LAMI|nr:hypothetical protein BUALT_Bualt06G0006700 [Buddleja alternifolia]